MGCSCFGGTPICGTPTTVLQHLPGVIGSIFNMRVLCSSRTCCLLQKIGFTGECHNMLQLTSDLPLWCALVATTCMFYSKALSCGVICSIC